MRVLALQLSDKRKAEEQRAQEMLAMRLKTDDDVNAYRAHLKAAKIVRREQQQRTFAEMQQAFLDEQKRRYETSNHIPTTLIQNVRALLTWLLDTCQSQYQQVVYSLS